MVVYVGVVVQQTSLYLVWVRGCMCGCMCGYMCGCGMEICSYVFVGGGVCGCCVFVGVGMCV